MFRRIILVVTFTYFVLSITQAQKYWKQPYIKADSVAAKVRKTKDIVKLASKLTSSFSDTVDRYRALYTWVALNIEYDIKALKNPNSAKCEAQDVLSRGKAICEGYANLYKALCAQSGLRCEIVSGWTKNSPTKIGVEFPAHTTHAWNAISINSKWYVCDVTWGAGDADSDFSKFRKEFKSFFFCTPMSIFSLNHYPESEKWFLGSKISKSDFQSAPHFYDIALDNNLMLSEPKNGTIEFKKGKKIDFKFTMDAKVDQILVKPSNAKTPVKVEFKQRKNTITFEYEMDKSAPYLVIFLNSRSALLYRMK